MICVRDKEEENVILIEDVPELDIPFDFSIVRIWRGKER